ncbi:MAG: MGMT family protein, partial [Bacillota bacterium]|nr:MGMT family protein [Bacillota bacterium]
PCHRVIGKNGDLVGFAGNRTPVQKKLLEVEGFIVK